MPTQRRSLCRETKQPYLQSCLNAQTRYVTPSWVHSAILNAKPRVEALAPTHGGVPLDELDKDAILAEFVLGHGHHQPFRWRGTVDSRLVHADFHDEGSRSELVRAWADRKLSVESVLADLEREGVAALSIIKGTSPAKDSSGNDLPETTDAEKDVAWRERQRLWNEFLCPLLETSMQLDLIEDRIANAERHALSPELEPAKRQLLSKFDRASGARLRYLFEGTESAANAKQRAAKDAVLRVRQHVIRDLSSATAVASARVATDARIVSLAGIGVAHSPDWLDDTGEPKGTACSVAYTKGSTPWKLDLAAQNTGKVVTEGSTRTRDDAFGPVKVEDFEHPEFELVTRTDLYPIVNDVYLRLQRKTGAAGHPEPGKYTLPLVARNFNGPSTLLVTVTVS